MTFMCLFLIGCFSSVRHNDGSLQQINISSALGPLGPLAKLGIHPLNSWVEKAAEKWRSKQNKKGFFFLRHQHNHPPMNDLCMEPVAGIEPATCCLRNSCSTTELHWRSLESSRNEAASSLGMPSFQERAVNLRIPREQAS